MSRSNGLDAATVVLLLVGAAVFVPVLAMGVGFGGGYLLVRRAVGTGPGEDDATNELRAAYARGDLTDEEFEARRTKLDESTNRR